MALNKVLIEGNIGGDITFANISNTTRVAKFSVAVSERWRDKNTGETRERTEWIRVEVIGKRVNYIEAAAQKGTQVFVQGAMKTDKYTDQNGVERYATKVVVQAPTHDVQVLSRGKPRGDQGASGTARDAGYDAPPPADLDDEIPF